MSDQMFYQSQARSRKLDKVTKFRSIQDKEDMVVCCLKVVDCRRGPGRRRGDWIIGQRRREGEELGES
jgi:hypothetical protein